MGRLFIDPIGMNIKVLCREYDESTGSTVLWYWASTHCGPYQGSRADNFMINI